LRVVTSVELTTIEEKAEASYGLDAGLLMERAGAAVAEEAARMASERARVLIVCGKGNNGGDGFVAARLLSEAGFKITVAALAPRETLAPLAKAAYEKMPPEVSVLTSGDSQALDSAIDEADLIIDAIFGFNLKGAVRGVAVEAIDKINGSHKPVLAVDMPSGLEADTGKAHGRAVKADATVTFTAPKVGAMLYPGLELTGATVVADIGIPEELIEENSGYRYLDAQEAGDLLPVRDPMSHKKSVGQVLVIAGSCGMSGAAVLTGHAAYRMGAGLVAFAPPQGIVPVLSGALIEAIVWPQPETEAGSLFWDARGSLFELAGQYDVVALGPGLSTNPRTVEFVKKLVATIEKPLVIDADALNALADDPDILKNRDAVTVITPHPGELARLYGVSGKDVLGDWLGFARRARERFGAVVVLKGATTVICGAAETTINVTGNPGLATAGTGDVLTGFIAALMAQGVDPYNAACLGVYLHGFSADIAAEDIGELSLMASDVIEYLPEALAWVMGWESRA